MLSPKLSPKMKKKALRLAGTGSVEDLLKFADAQQCDLSVFVALSGPQGETLLHRAASQNNVAVVVFLLVNNFVDANVRNDQMKSPLHEAATYGALEATLALLEFGACAGSVRTFSWTPLMYAASRGHGEIVKALVGAGASVEDTNKEGMTALYVAGREGALNCVQYLHECGADLNVATETLRTPLFCSVMNDHKEVAEYLVDHGARFACRDSSNATIWHEIAQSNSIRCFEAFVSRGLRAPIGERDVLGRHPVHIAAAEGNHEILRLMLENCPGIVDLLDSVGNTALLLASCRGNHLCAGHLLQFQCNAAIPDPKGRTPLHLAVGFKQYNVVKLLMTSPDGCDLDATDHAGVTPRSMAEKAGAMDILKILTGTS
jgi:ankyrin repeat protein